jgi:hypothetical protein
MAFPAADHHQPARIAHPTIPFDRDRTAATERDLNCRVVMDPEISKRAGHQEPTGPQVPDTHKPA